MGAPDTLLVYKPEEGAVVELQGGDRKGVVVAEVRGDVPGGRETADRWGQLFAVAPELLHELRLAALTLEQVAADYGVETEEAEYAENAASAARIIIRKAEGK